VRAKVDFPDPDAPTSATEPQAQQQVVQRRPGRGLLPQRARLGSGLQLGPEPLELGAVEGDVGVVERGVLGAGQLAGDQVRHVGQPELLVQPEQVRLDLAGAHQVDACQEHAVDVEQRLDPARALLLEQLPLRLGEAAVVVAVVARDAAARDRLQLLALARPLALVELADRELGPAQQHLAAVDQPQVVALLALGRLGGDDADRPARPRRLAGRAGGRDAGDDLDADRHERRPDRTSHD
jgi:hypothetical protein